MCFVFLVEEFNRVNSMDRIRPYNMFIFGVLVPVLYMTLIVFVIVVGFRALFLAYFVINFL